MKDVSLDMNDVPNDSHETDKKQKKMHTKSKGKGMKKAMKKAKNNDRAKILNRDMGKKSGGRGRKRS